MRKFEKAKLNIAFWGVLLVMTMNHPQLPAGIADRIAAVLSAAFLLGWCGYAIFVGWKEAA